MLTGTPTGEEMEQEGCSLYPYFSSSSLARALARALQLPNNRSI